MKINRLIGILICISFQYAYGVNENIIVLLGLPGAGKTTCSKLLQKKGYVHIYPGEIFRQSLNNRQSKLSMYRKLILLGKPLPDRLVCNIIKKKMKGHPKIVIDGFPRNVEQSKFLLSKIKRKHARLSIYFLNVSKDILLSRITTRIACSNCHNTFSQKDIENKFKCPICKQNKLYIRNSDNIEKAKERISKYNISLNKVIIYLKKNYSVKEISNINELMKIEEKYDRS